MNYSDFSRFFGGQEDIMGGLQAGAGAQQPVDYNQKIFGDLQNAYQEYGVLGLGLEGLKHGIGGAASGAARGMSAVGQPVASGLQQVGQYTLGQQGTEALGDVFTGSLGGGVYGALFGGPNENSPPAQAQGGYAPPTPAPMSSEGMPPAQAIPQAPPPTAGAGMARAPTPGGGMGQPSAPAAGGGAPAGSIYDLPQFGQEMMAKHAAMAPPSVPTPPQSEELLRVLAGLAGGASQWSPGQGGVARSIAAAGAGGLGAGLGYEQELRQASFADQQARYQHGLQGMELESNLRLQGAKLSIMQQEVEARETYNQLRMMSEAAKQFRASHKISAVAGTGGITLYDQQGHTQFVPEPMSVVGVMEHADKLKALGTPQTGVNSFITENLALAPDMPDGLRENYTLATHAVFNELIPEHLAALREQLMEDPGYGMAMQAAAKGDPMALSEQRRREVMALSNLLEHNAEMREYIKDRVGSGGTLGINPAQQGLRFLTE